MLIQIITIKIILICKFSFGNMNMNELIFVLFNFKSKIFQWVATIPEDKTKTQKTRSESQGLAATHDDSRRS